MLAVQLAPARLVALVVALTVPPLPACSDLTAPPGEDPRALPQLPERDAGARPQKSTRSSETVTASHILVAYKGARRAGPQVTRTKDEARAEANRILGLARAPDSDFAALARAHSDDPGSGPRGGSLGSFQRDSMTQPFSDAAFALRPGLLSEVVETEFGFHIIKRAQ